MQTADYSIGRTLLNKKKKPSMPFLSQVPNTDEQWKSTYV